jgi:hypothetical protein
MADRIAFPLPDGRWLELSREQFEAALVAGAESVAAVPAPRPVDRALEPLLDAERAASLLGVTARWLEASARADIVPHHKLGRFIRFRVSEVAEHSRIPGAPPPTDSLSVTPIRRLARQ